MSKSKHVTFGGPGQHEFYFPTTGKGHKNRRDRRKCDYYEAASRYCCKLCITCVGPTLCTKYSTTKSEQPHTEQNCKKNHPSIGTTVYNAQNKEGKIITISGDICTIQFSTGKKVAAKYPGVFENGIFKTEKFMK